MQNNKLIGSLEIPGDKSISHRVLIFASFCQGTSEIEGLSPAQDCMSTAQCLKALGLKIETGEQRTSGKSYIAVQSAGLKNLQQPEKTLFVGNSGTSIRLLAGLAAGLPFVCNFDGDESIRKRPMARVLDHLQEMGAHIDYTQKKGLAPFRLAGGNLVGKDFKLKIASAQVQTALLLAGLQAEGKTSVHLPGGIRDHTTRLFTYMGVPFDSDQGSVSVEKLTETIKPFKYKVPGDISSAAFFMVAAACLPGSKIVLKNVGINAGRTLVIDVLKRMGADITLLNARIAAEEPVADIEIVGSDRLVGTEVGGDEIAAGVDEIPVLALAGALCDGQFTVRDAEELRHKESDRLKLITENLKAAGVELTESQDGFSIVGKKSIAGGSAWQTHLDHRLAMSGLVANLLCDKPVLIEETASTAISYPTFESDLKSLVSKASVSI